MGCDERVDVLVLQGCRMVRCCIAVHVLYIHVDVGHIEQVLDVAHAVEVCSDVKRGETLAARLVDVDVGR